MSRLVEFHVYRDGVDLQLEVELEYQPAEPDVGIMSGGYAVVGITPPCQLTSSEEETVCEYDGDEGPDPDDQRDAARERGW